MTTMPRRGTFVLSEYQSSESSESPRSGINRQNVMRLRINRIALVQELKVECIIPYLLDNGIISDEDCRKIEAGTTSQDKARLLIDLLPTAGKSVDWYKYFREALQNPEGGPEVRKRYKTLVEFLDNTLIHRPTSQASRFSSVEKGKRGTLKLPHYEPIPSIKAQKSESGSLSTAQNILNLDDERKGGKGRQDEGQEKGTKDSAPENQDKFSPWSHDNLEAMTLVKGYFQQWVATPENYRSLINAPEEHFRTLQESSSQEDREQLQEETKALERMKKLELVSVMARRKLLPDGFELCMCDIVHDILFDPDSYHYYFKYFKMLEASEINLLADLTNSFLSVVSNITAGRNIDTTKQVLDLGFHIVDLLADYGFFRVAEAVMGGLMSFLSGTDEMDVWMLKYKGYTKLMHLRNRNYEFIKANQAYFLAKQVTWQIKMMSFGKDLLAEGDMAVELSTLLLEFGSIGPAMGWAQSALKTADFNDHRSVVNVLCNAVMAYSAKWQVKRAEKLAVQAVQYARYHLGGRHPLYVKALLHYCHFASEFKQDKDALHIAEHTLKTAKKIYGCDTLQVALSHRAVSKALLVLQQFEDGRYHLHAQEALKVAQNTLIQDHPMLYLFLHTSASALQWKALHSPADMQVATLGLAEAEARKALALVSEHYGEISLKTSQLYSLLGQIYAKMDRIQNAEIALDTSVIYMKLCQSETSNFLMLAMATLGTFYRIIGKPKEAVAKLRHVVNTIESVGVYLKWVHVCFEHLIGTLESLGNNKEADEMRICLSQWLRDNPKYDKQISLEELSNKPQPYDKFVQDFNIWEKKTKKVLNFAKAQLKEKEDRREEESQSPPPQQHRSLQIKVAPTLAEH